MSDLGLSYALRDLIAGITPAVVPMTTLTAPAVAGSSAPLQVANNQHFVAGGRFAFFDQLGEEMLGIKDKTAPGISPATITLDFNGVGYLGLQHTHSIGTPVYTNLQANAPVEMAPSLALGDPYIFVTGVSEHTMRVAQFNRTRATFVFRVQYHRQLTPPTPMDVNLWADRQQIAARADLETISQAIIANPKLQVSNQQWALSVGDVKNENRPIITKSWFKFPVSADTEQFAAAMDVVVTGQYNPFS